MTGQALLTNRTARSIPGPLLSVRPRLACSTYCALSLAAILSVGCRHVSATSPPVSTAAPQVANCGPELSTATLLDIAKAAITVAGGDPFAAEVQFELAVHPADCDYLVSGVSRDHSTAHLAIRINRSGNVISWPWCCVPEFFVFPTALPAGHGDQPPNPSLQRTKPGRSPGFGR